MRLARFAILLVLIPWTMAAADEKERVSELFSRGAVQSEATRVAEGIFLASGTGNAYRGTSSSAAGCVTRSQRRSERSRSPDPGC